MHCYVAILTGCHLRINKGLMYFAHTIYGYASVYACHHETCYNFKLLTRINSDQNDITPYISVISVNLQ